MRLRNRDYNLKDLGSFSHDLKFMLVSNSSMINLKVKNKI